MSLIMNRYTNAETTDMHLIYGLADGNAFPDRIAPDRKTFECVHRHLYETGTLRRNGGSGRPRTARTVELEEDVLNMIEEDPGTSTRKIADALDVINETVWYILKDNLLYPQWRNGIKNFHNNHLWCDENPHEIFEDRFQHQFSLNVWIGIVGYCLIGSVFYQEDLPEWRVLKWFLFLLKYEKPAASYFFPLKIASDVPIRAPLSQLGQRVTNNAQEGTRHPLPPLWLHPWKMSFTVGTVSIKLNIVTCRHPTVCVKAVDKS
ncbi:hypothetical protein NQ318_015618, partial [Aromia moschata]